MALIISTAGALISWYYSKRSGEHAEQSLCMMKQQYALTKEDTLIKYIDEACNVFKKDGTPIHYINSLPIESDRKEEIWKQSYMRIKKRLPQKTFLEKNKEILKNMESQSLTS